MWRWGSALSPQACSTGVNTSHCPPSVRPLSALCQLSFLISPALCSRPSQLLLTNSLMVDSKPPLASKPSSSFQAVSLSYSWPQQATQLKGHIFLAPSRRVWLRNGVWPTSWKWKSCINHPGTGKMAWQSVPSVVTFAGDRSSAPSACVRQLTTTCNSSSRGSDAPFWPLQHCSHTHIPTYRQTHR